MPDTAVVTATPADGQTEDQTDDQLAIDALVEDDQLVEEVSIDGMCGVY